MSSRHARSLIVVIAVLVVVSLAVGLSHRSTPSASRTTVGSTSTSSPSTTSSSPVTTTTGRVTTTTAKKPAPRDPGLPNPSLTPGALNLAVTEATLNSTICVSGYTKTVRPPESYTYHLKVSQLDSGYNYRGDLSTADYEEDHLVPLEIGGSPSAVTNLWPEPRNVTWGASAKDQLENRLHSMICDGSISLATARHVFMNNWIVGYRLYVVA